MNLHGHFTVALCAPRAAASTLATKCGTNDEAREDRHHRRRSHRWHARGAVGEVGHPVILSSRHPEELKPLAEKLGPLATVGTPKRRLRKAK